jgi:hypothetical protein
MDNCKIRYLSLKWVAQAIEMYGKEINLTAFFVPAFSVSRCYSKRHEYAIL